MWQLKTSLKYKPQDILRIKPVLKLHNVSQKMSRSTSPTTVKLESVCFTAKWQNPLSWVFQLIFLKTSRLFSGVITSCFFIWFSSVGGHDYFFFKLMNYFHYRLKLNKAIFRFTDVHYWTFGSGHLDTTRMLPNIYHVIFSQIDLGFVCTFLCASFAILFLYIFYLASHINWNKKKILAQGTNSSLCALSYAGFRLVVCLTVRILSDSDSLNSCQINVMHVQKGQKMHNHNVHHTFIIL